MMQKMISIGRITKKPEMDKYDNSRATYFHVAVDEGKDKAGNKITTYIPMKAWDKVADYIVQYADKGDLVYIEGRYKSFDSQKDGKTSKTVYIAVREFKFLSSPRKKNNGEHKSENTSDPKTELKQENKNETDPEPELNSIEQIVAGGLFDGEDPFDF